MRKPPFILLLIILIDTSIPCFSQIAIGIKGGSNFSKVQFYKRPEIIGHNINTIQGFQYGAVIRYVSEKHAGMHIELLFSQKGYIDEVMNDTVYTKSKRTINYFQIPFNYI